MNDPARLFIALYTDEDITSELAPALRERGFEAQSAEESLPNNIAVAALVNCCGWRCG